MSEETFSHAAAPSPSRQMPADHRVERRMARLPLWLGRTVSWLRRPASRWIRVPAGMLLILGALLSILPFFGLWMLPLGVVLLAEDFAAARRARDRVLAWAEQHRPHWFAGSEGGATPGATLQAARFAAATVVTGAKALPTRSAGETEQRR